MALLICSECEGKVSSLAASCPHCGAPVPSSAQPSPEASSRATTTSTTPSSYGAASASSSAAATSTPRPGTPYRPEPASTPSDVPLRPSSTSNANTNSTTSRQPLPLNVPLRTYKGQTRAVSVPLLLGIFFLPIVFAWFLLQKGYSTLARVAGFAWLFFVAFLVFGLLRLASDLFWHSPATPDLTANGVTTTQPIDPAQVPLSQRPLQQLTLPTPQPQNNPVPAQQTFNGSSQQIQSAQDPVQFNQPPQTIDNAANTAANSNSNFNNSSSDNPVNPFNDTRPIHSADSQPTQ